MKQVLVDGFFHGDPHPGNLMINLDNGVIQFLDQGMVGEIDLQQRISLGDLLFSMQSRDPDGMASALLGVSVPFRADADAAGLQARHRASRDALHDLCRCRRVAVRSVVGRIEEPGR